MTATIHPAQPTQPMAPETTDVLAVVEQVWSSFLGETEQLVFLPPQDEPLRGEAWSAAVSVTGAWEGTVTVELGAPVALALTGLMLGEDPTGAPPAEEDVADAVGELVNMVGGNVKSLMPGPSALSLPNVAVGRAAHPSDTVEVSRVDAQWSGEPVRVSVHVAQPQG